MKTAHEIVRNYTKTHHIDMEDFREWFNDARYPEGEANIHDFRYLNHLESYVEERDARD